jgi:hypothetical protein
MGFRVKKYREISLKDLFTTGIVLSIAELVGLTLLTRFLRVTPIIPPTLSVAIEY